MTVTSRLVELGAPGNSDAWARVVTIERPERRNALDLATKAALIAAIRAADADPSVSAIVLTGSASVFVAGTDVDEMSTMTPVDHIVRRTGEVFAVLDGTQTFTVAAVEGAALGGGCELAMACDLVVAGESASFGQPEIRVGLVPGAGGLSRLVHRAGRTAALRLALTGDSVSAREALALGIVSDVVPDGQSVSAALALATGIASTSPLSRAALRRVARHAESTSLSAALQYERAVFELMFSTVDAHEGMSAFTQRRAPAYVGR